MRGAQPYQGFLAVHDSLRCGVWHLVILWYFCGVSVSVYAKT